MKTEYEFYLQTDANGSKSLRRYPAGSQKGERWDESAQAWTKFCAERLACEQTGDRKITAEEATAFVQ